MNDQIIKWSGSKRSQAKLICSKIPNRQYNTYFEPFCGSSSILIELLNTKNKNKFNSFTCSDINKDLINLWNFIKKYPESKEIIHTMIKSKKYDNILDFKSIKGELEQLNLNIYREDVDGVLMEC